MLLIFIEKLLLLLLLSKIVLFPISLDWRLKAKALVLNISSKSLTTNWIVFDNISLKYNTNLISQDWSEFDGTKRIKSQSYGVLLKDKFWTMILFSSWSSSLLLYLLDTVLIFFGVFLSLLFIWSKHKNFWLFTWNILKISLFFIL